jgi:hypothetical protein
LSTLLGMGPTNQPDDPVPYSHQPVQISRDS